MKKAYSYLRFSTPEQSKGDSFRRQMEETRKYALLNDLMLNEELTFHDLGVSAFKGKNAETGRLGDFLKAVENGLVEKGSVLLVESLDRISRQFARKAFRVLEDICDSGVSVLTLSDRREYTSENLNKDPASLLSAILVFIRANEESESKSSRLRDAWYAKRLKLIEKPMTSRGPAWLLYDFDAHRWNVIEERAAIIRRIFSETAAGSGEHVIAKGLNEDGIATWGDNGRAPAVMWHRSYVAKIIRSQSVIGNLVPFTSEIKDNETKRVALSTVPGYYPPVIEMPLWEQVQSIKSSRSPMRGAHSEQPIQNVLGGLAKCARCGSTMTRINKGKRQPIPKLVCVKAKSGAGCKYEPISLDIIEDGLRENFKHKDEDMNAEEWNLIWSKAADKDKIEYDSLCEQIEGMLKNSALMKFDDVQKTVTDLLSRKQEMENERLALSEVRKLITNNFYSDRCNELHELFGVNDIDRQKINTTLRQIYTSVQVDLDEYSIGLKSRFNLFIRIHLKRVTTEDRQRSNAGRAERDEGGRFVRL